MSDLAPAHVIAPRRRPLAFELVFVVLVSLIVLVPGIWRYTLVDPWETHYGEVAREMLQNNDWVHTEWRGTMDGNPGDNEGFRSKPVLQFWMMAASMRALNVAPHGGYSGELTDTPMTMVAIRLPFILSAILGLVLLWWMLARLVSRRCAWFTLLIVGTMPMFCLISRQAIPDMPLVACTMGAVALFTMAVEDGARPIFALFHVGRRRIPIDARHIVLGISGAFVAIQAIYYMFYFFAQPTLAVRGAPNPAISLPFMMAGAFAIMSADLWLIVRLPFVLIGGVYSAIKNLPVPTRQPGQTLWRHVFDDILGGWDAYAADRVVLTALLFPVALLLGDTWRDAATWARRIMRIEPITTMRQLYLLGCYFLLGVSILAKGPPGLTVVGVVGALYLIVLGKWRDLYDGGFELKRGVALLLVVAIPWHLAMFYADGLRFINEYLFQHILNRAAAGVDDSFGTFARANSGPMYSAQMGHGMWLWGALLPAALAAAFMRSRLETREGRVRFMMALWAISAVAVFCLVQTKFHHYILPALPPLGVLVAFQFDDIWEGRDRFHPLWALVAVGIVLLICRDLMFEPERWIEMFVYRYDRPWPTGDPYTIDPSQGFLILGIAAAVAIPLLASRFPRVGIAAVCTVGLAIGVWSLQSYMPVAGRHWGMGDAMRTYYKQRTVYGQHLVYFSNDQLAKDWRGVTTTWSFDTVIPDDLLEGQPMTIKVGIAKDNDEKLLDNEITLVGTTTKIGEHTITVTFAPGERAKLDPLIKTKSAPKGRARKPLLTVDADRLIGWQLYWRGENFWSGDEVWAYLPEQKTQFNKTDNVELLKYLNDHQRAPLGRRYFVITEAGRAPSFKSIVPTARGRDTYDVIDTTSNKFSLGAFWL
ncbi:MAG TPA: glycosyltransferase family 39 protein [Kofleriaceae bacterium]